MSTEANVLNNLQERHQRLLREHAVLEAREAEKAKRRDELRTQLRAAGVDPDQPEAEATRLEAEIKRIQDQNEAALDEFEAQLKAATLGQPLLTEPADPPQFKRAPEVRSVSPLDLEEAQRRADAGVPMPVAPTLDEPFETREPNIESEPQQTSAPTVTSEPSETRAPPRASDNLPISADIDLC